MDKFFGALGLIAAVVLPWIAASMDPQWFNVACLFFVFAFVICLDAIGEDHTKRYLLEGTGLERGHAAALTRVLDWFDRRLVPAEMLDPDDPRYQLQRSARRGWNATAFDRCLLIAVAYPIVLPLLLWTGWNLPATLGELEVIAAADSIWPRLAVGGVIAILVFSGAIAHWITPKWISPLARGFVPQRLRVSEPAGLDVLLVQMAVILGAVGVAIALTFATLGFFTVAFIVAFTIAPVSTFAYAGAFAVAAASLTSGAFSGAFSVEDAGVFAYIVVITVFPALNWILRQTVEKERYHLPVYTGLTLLTIATPFIVALALPDVSATNRIILVFFTLFPILNALFDFLSQGVTRLCLRGALATPWRVLGFNLRPLVYSLTDLFVALVLLGGLIVSLLVAVHTLNTIAAQPFLDIDALLNAVAARSPEALWLYLMVFSTLLPTALHFAFFLVHTLAQFPGALLRQALAGMRPETGSEDGLRAGAYILGVAAWMTVVIYGVYLVILRAFPSLLPLQDRIIGWTVATAQDIYLLLPY